MDSKRKLQEKILKVVEVLRTRKRIENIAQEKSYLCQSLDE